MKQESIRQESTSWKAKKQEVMRQEAQVSLVIRHGVGVMADYLVHGEVVSNPGIVMLRCGESIVWGAEMKFTACW